MKKGLACARGWSIFAGTKFGGLRGPSPHLVVQRHLFPSGGYGGLGQLKVPVRLSSRELSSLLSYFIDVCPLRLFVTWFLGCDPTS
jgi:hypothetical protein